MMNLNMILRGFNMYTVSVVCQDQTTKKWVFYTKMNGLEYYYQFKTFSEAILARQLALRQLNQLERQVL